VITRPDRLSLLATCRSEEYHRINPCRLLTITTADSQSGHNEGSWLSSLLVRMRKRARRDGCKHLGRGSSLILIAVIRLLTLPVAFAQATVLA